MNKRNFLIVFALFLMALGAAILPTKAQDEPVRNVLTMSVGCPSDFGDFVAVPVGYTALYDVGSQVSSTNATDYTQFVGYYPDGQARFLQAGQYENYFTVLFDKAYTPNFSHVENVSWSVSYYDFVEMQTVTVNVTRNGNAGCDITPTPSPDPLPTAENLKVQMVQSTGRVCTISYPSLVLVCH